MVLIAKGDTYLKNSKHFRCHKIISFIISCILCLPENTLTGLSNRQKSKLHNINVNCYIYFYKPNNIFQVVMIIGRMSNTLEVYSTSICISQLLQQLEVDDLKYFVFLGYSLSLNLSESHCGKILFCHAVTRLSHNGSLLSQHDS